MARLTTTHGFGHDGDGCPSSLRPGRSSPKYHASSSRSVPTARRSCAQRDRQSIAVANRLLSRSSSGEHFEPKGCTAVPASPLRTTGNGRFNRLDPFAGNMQDPQSLHKYTDVHGDPIAELIRVDWNSTIAGQVYRYDSSIYEGALASALLDSTLARQTRYSKGRVLMRR